MTVQQLSFFSLNQERQQVAAEQSLQGIIIMAPTVISYHKNIFLWGLPHRHGKSFNPSTDTIYQQMKFPQMNFLKFPQVTRIIVETILHILQI